MSRDGSQHDSENSALSGMSEGQLEIEGDLVCQGLKNFAQAVETPSGELEVRYTAVEAGKALTEVTDRAELTDGTAVIELPEHFAMVTSETEPVFVQITPHASEEVQPQVVDQSLERIEVEDFGDGPDDYSISFTVKGVRDGYEDQNVTY